MSCTNPLVGFRARYSNPSTGKYSVVFNSKEGSVGDKVIVGCGKCCSCVEGRAWEWFVRCLHESKMHEFNSFVTLTYDDDNLPKQVAGELTQDYMQLNYRDVQLFHKRLRDNVGPFRFFVVAEVGDVSRRLHWHGIYFGLRFADSVRVGGPDAAPVFKSEILERNWSKGMCSVGPVEPGSIRYVCNYMSKPVEGDGVRVKFQRMSRDPGLGKSYFDKYWRDAFPRDEVIIDGEPVQAPKRYVDWLEEVDSDMAFEVRSRRMEEMRKAFDKSYGSRLYQLADSAQIRSDRKNRRRVLDKALTEYYERVNRET